MHLHSSMAASTGVMPLLGNGRGMAAARACKPGPAVSRGGVRMSVTGSLRRGSSRTDGGALLACGSILP